MKSALHYSGFSKTLQQNLKTIAVHLRAHTLPALFKLIETQCAWRNSFAIEAYFPAEISAVMATNVGAVMLSKLSSTIF